MITNEKPSSNPIAALLQQIRNKIYDRIQHGDLNYSRDMFTLEKHLQIAQELNQPRVIALTHTMLGFVESRAGNFANAEKHYLNVIGVLEPLREFDILCSVQVYLGDVYRYIGKNVSAINAYQTAQQFAQHAEDRRTGLSAESNLGVAWLSEAQSEKAQVCFQQVLKEAERELWLHLPALVQAQWGMGEVCLAQSNFDRAWHYADTAEMLSTERDDKLLMARAYLTKAHIADADPTRHKQADNYYKLAQHTLRTAPMPLITLARTLLEEARYHQRRQQLGEVVRLAREAHALFEELHLAEEMKLAEGLLG